MTFSPLLQARTFAALLLAATILAGCGETNSSIPHTSLSQPLRIVSSFPKKGAAVVESKQIVQAIDLAISEHAIFQSNPRIEHIKMDDGADENGAWSPRIESDIAERAVSDPQVIALIGPYTSGATGVALPITNRAHLLTLGPTATWPGLTLDGWEPGEVQKYNPLGQRNFARLSLPDSRQAEAAANWAKQLGSHGAYVVDDGSSYSAGLASQFVRTAHDIGLNVIARSSLDQRDDTKLGSLLKEANADALFFAPSTIKNAVQISLLLEADQLTANVFVSDTALNDEFLETVGSKISRWHFTFNGGTRALEAGRYSEFARHYLLKYGVEPQIGAARAYDMTTLVLDAVDSMQTPQRNAITERVLKTKNYKGVSGNISFDERGDVDTRRMDGFTVRNSQFVLDRTILW